MQSISEEEFRKQLNELRVNDGNWEDNIMMIAKLYKALGYELRDMQDTEHGLHLVRVYIANMLQNMGEPTISQFYKYKTFEYLVEELKSNNRTITPTMIERVFSKKSVDNDYPLENLDKSIEDVYMHIAPLVLKKVSQQENFTKSFATFMTQKYTPKEVKEILSDTQDSSTPLSSYFFEFYKCEPAYRKYIEDAFADEIKKAEKMLSNYIKKALINKIQTTIKFFKSCGYLDKIVDINNNFMAKMGLDFLKVTTKEDKEKFNVMNLTSDNYLNQFDMNELFVLGAFYANRLEKVMNNLCEGMFLQRKLDILYETVEYGELPRRMDVDDIRIILKQQAFLDSLSRDYFFDLKFKAEDERKFSEKEVLCIPKEFLEKYSDIYNEYFARFIPNSKNNFEKDYMQNYFSRLSSYLMYASKDFSIESFLYTLSDKKSKINFGIVEEEIKKKNEYGEKQVLIGIDLKEFTTIMLHFPEKDFKEFVARFFASRKFPKYYGNEDLEFRTQPIKTHIAYKFTKAQKQQIKKLYETMDKKNILYPYVRHLYWNIHPAQNPLNSKKKDIEI